VIIPGRHELPPQAGVNYTAFMDPSGGRGDAAALALAHVEGERVVLDLARRWPAPHNPQSVIREMAEILRAYGVRRVTGGPLRWGVAPAGVFPAPNCLRPGPHG
jgi:hypothetical protein